MREQITFNKKHLNIKISTILKEAKGGRLVEEPIVSKSLTKVPGHWESSMANGLTSLFMSLFTSHKEVEFDSSVIGKALNNKLAGHW